MSRSDEPPPSSASFSGDGSGKIFDSPDMVWSNSTAAERVVDTQSGFLVVVRQVEGKQSLLVKRRLGTPPSSAVTLTPDESIQLAKILMGSGTGATDTPAFASEAEAFLSKFPKDIESSSSANSADAATESFRRARRAAKRRIRGIAVISSATILLICALIGYSLDALKTSVFTVLHP